MNRQELLENLSQDIIAYVMKGSLPEYDISRRIKPDELDERFNDYQLLLDLHFILKDDVIDFVRNLPQRLRSIKTDTQTNSQLRRGGIEGNINWGSTIKQRYSTNPRDRSLFVCDNRSVYYNIPENLVLKKTIAIIHNTVQQSKSYLSKNYGWVEDTWRGEEELIDELERIIERNVHVDRIREPKAYEPNERMLIAAENARDPLYREAANLLRDRQKIHDGDKEELEELLERTAITPDDDSTLFELFILFRFVSVLENMRNDSPKFEKIETGRQEVARFENNPQIKLYHDNSGSDNISFKPEETLSPPLSRSEKLQRVAHEIANDYFQKNFRNYTGRPDVIVLEIHDEATSTYEFLVTEVKYSKKTGRIRKGIKETLEYLAFLRVDDSFVFEGASTDDYFGTGWNGLLVIQDLERETQEFSDQNGSEIKILQASEVQEKLDNILEESFTHI